MLAQRPREWAPVDWAMIQSAMGGALSRLGERESGTARLEDALTAYRAALEEVTKDSMPMLWARMQSNLGSVLALLGERECGTARLEDAVVALRAALEVPVLSQWALTRSNLGSALALLGARKGDTARLEEALMAYRAGRSSTVYGTGHRWRLGVDPDRLGHRTLATWRMRNRIAPP
jgi:hypothetical protein